MSEISVRKNYYSLDVAKFVCAIMILTAHFVAENCNFKGAIDYIFSLYIFAVPFFFACSGFLFFEKLNLLNSNKDKHDYFIKYQKRIWIMYLCWTIIYWTFQTIKYAMYGVTLETLLSQIYTTLVYTSYGTIWFLPALAVAIAVVYFARNFKTWILLIGGCVLYVIGCLGYSYTDVLNEIPVLSSLFSIYNKVFLTTRNGLFNGTPLVLVGYFIAKNRNGFNIWCNGVLAIVFCGFTIVEAFLCKLYISPSAPGADTLIMLVPATYFIVSTLVMIDIKKRAVFVWMRKLSLLMFTSQRLFLTAIPSLYAAFLTPFTINQWFGIVMINVVVIGFDVVVIILSKKSKIIGYLV